jgi:hypothetical protein
MAFLDSLRNFDSNTFLSTINEQVGSGENVSRSLDSVDPNDPNRVVAFGSLGNFASKIDNTAQRSYLESGYIRNIRPRYFEIMMQQPDVTILVKKRMFSTLIENYDVEKMDSGDRGFYKSAKRLFQNKCQAISIYEKLSKVEKVIQNKGVLDDFFVPVLISGIQTLEHFGVNIVDTKTKDTLNEIRKLNAFSEPLNYTTWLVDPSTPYDFGEGTGVFELTLVSSVTTNSGLRLGSGNGNLTIEDPYHLMMITPEDIDKAIADIYNPAKNSQLFQFSESVLADQNQQLLNRLNADRQRRGVPGIIIRTSPSSRIYKRVSAFIDLVGKEIIFNYDPGIVGINGNVTFDFSATDVSSSSSNLNAAEADLLSDIIRNTYQIINLRRDKERDLDLGAIDDTTDQGIKLKNEIRYVREKMRLHFLNKNIIQVMDSVHVYMNSNTMIDSKVSGIDRSGVTNSSSNLLSKLNSNVNNLEQSFNNLKGFWGGTDAGSFVELEKSAIVGPDFPTWLWVSMRNDFTRQAAGTHVFAGLVNSVTENFSDGFYTLNVNMSDNSHYFNLGLINKKPSVDVLERNIYDPYTPFDLDFDPSGFAVGRTPKLLHENQVRLDSGLIKFKNGSKFLGSPASIGLYVVGDDRKDINNLGNVQKIFYDPDGFVYRWKSGIGTYTYNGPKYYDAFSQGVFSQGLGTPAITNNIYAGQDVMNVLSLLISGVPYNYNTFLKASIGSGNLSLNKVSNQNVTNTEIARSFFKGFISDLKKQNATWGNFVPFKKLIMSEKSYQFMINGQFTIQTANKDIEDLLNQRSKIFDTLTLVNSAFADNPTPYRVGTDGSLQPRINLDSNIQGSVEVFEAMKKIKNIDDKLDRINRQIQSTIAEANTNNGQIKIFGNDFSFDPEYSESTATNTDEEFQRARINLRRKTKYLTQRRLWKVKSNDDFNLLVIDDTYDKDYDIQAFEKSLGSMELFRSEYANIMTQIDSVASILGLEVFADSQGHINVKPPTFNKVPSSVFTRLITSGEKLYPKQLEDLFVGQADSLIDRLEILEDEIRLRTIALGYNDDSSAGIFLSGSAVQGNENVAFSFLTDEQGNFGSKGTSVKTMISMSNPDLRESIEKRPLKPVLEKVSGQLRKTALFDSVSQIKTARDKYITNADNASRDRYNTVKIRLQQKSARSYPNINELRSNVRVSDVGNNLTQGSILKLTREISSKITERQQIIKSLYNAIKNIDDASVINSNDSNTKKAALFPSLYKKEKIPSVLEHMIEDENEDDLGPGSGGRYIIKDDQIISMSISENPPEFTAIEVNGSFSQGQTNESGFNTGTVGGLSNFQSNALAVDYDMWRMYGFKYGSAVPAIYFNNPETQCAPFAVWQLNNQRRKIISGTLTIIGNEYMQQGEVIYIESRDLLFYVENVSHNFTYGSNFTTTLTLTYGHNPGEYFPTMLDIIGKALYSKAISANSHKHIREGNSFGYDHLGTLVVDRFNAINANDPLKRLVAGKFGEKNRNVLSNILLSLKSAELQAATPQIELRIYKNSKQNKPATSVTNQLIGICEEVKAWLSNPTKESLSPDNNSLLQTSTSVTPDLDGEFLKPGYDINSMVITKEIDEEDPYSPSGEAWMYSENVLSTNPGLNSYLPDVTADQMAGSVQGSQINTNNSNTNGVTANAYSNANKKYKQDDINNYTPTESDALYSSIIDIWIKFVPVPETPETSTRTNLGNNQLQNVNNQII